MWMKKFLIGFSALMLAACSSDPSSTIEQEGNGDTLPTEQTDTNEGDSLIAEDTIEAEEMLPGSLQLLNELLEWDSYEVDFATLKQFEAEEKIDEETYKHTSYIQEPTELYEDYKSIGFHNTYYEVYVNNSEGYMNNSMNGWEQMDDFQNRLTNTMPVRVKLLEMLTLSSTYIDQEIVEGNFVREQYELRTELLTDIYKNIDAYIVYSKLFDDLSIEEQALVNDTVLNDIKSGRFHMIYDANEQVEGYEVVIAFNESDLDNAKLTDIFALSEAFSNVNKVKIERPEGL